MPEMSLSATIRRHQIVETAFNDYIVAVKKGADKFSVSALLRLKLYVFCLELHANNCGNPSLIHPIRQENQVIPLEDTFTPEAMTAYIAKLEAFYYAKFLEQAMEDYRQAAKLGSAPPVFETFAETVGELIPTYVKWPPDAVINKVPDPNNPDAHLFELKFKK